MKKIIILLGMLIAAISIQAQTVQTNMRNGYINFTGAASDTVAGATSISKDIGINATEPYLFDITVDVDTLLVAASNPNFTCLLYGSMDDITYYQIGSTLTCYGNSDTVFRFNNYAKTIADVNTISAFDVPIDGTQGIAAFNIWAYDSILYDDTLHVNAQTLTRTDTLVYPAQTHTHAITETDNAVMWRYLRVTVTGSSNARIELEKIAGAILPKRY